ncbi:hypothetical protein ACOMHN_051888 [Nucella lapillus]
MISTDAVGGVKCLQGALEDIIRQTLNNLATKDDIRQLREDMNKITECRSARGAAGQTNAWVRLVHRAQGIRTRDLGLKSTLDTITGKQERRQQEPTPDLDDEDDPQNLAVFLRWVLVEAAEAEIRTERAEAETEAARMVQEHPDSLLALSNQAYILWHNRQPRIAVEHLCTLETLKQANPRQYENLEMDAQSEIMYLYVRLSYIFKPYALSDFQERLLRRRPHDSMKFTLGQTFRRYTNPSYSRKYPQVDFLPAMRRAIQLFVEIKDNQTNSPDLRARASAELGETLNWHAEEKMREAIDKEQALLRIRPAQCFEEAIQLAEDKPAALVCAGKFFRYKNLRRSKELLEKAAIIRPEPKVHHQLGLTLRKLALQGQKQSRNYPPPRNQGRDTRRGRSSQSNWRGVQHDQTWGRDSARHYQQGERIANGLVEVLSKEDRLVREAVHHFQQSLDLSSGYSFVALFDLGLMHLSLQEYDQALEHFQKALDCSSELMFDFIKALQYIGLVLAEMAKNEKRHQEMSQFCLHLFLIIQCRLVLQSGEEAAVSREMWASFHSLSRALQQPLKHLTTNTEAEERVLLQNLKSLSLPVLNDIAKYSKSQAVDSEHLKTSLQQYLREGRYQDALLFLYLLKLTSQSHLISTWQDSDLLRKTSVQLARYSLSKCIGKSDVKSKINAVAARTLFHIAFEDFSSEAAVTESSGELQTSLSKGASSLEEQLPVVHYPSQHPSAPSSQRAAREGHQHLDLSEPDLDDSAKDDTHVLLIYDPQGEEVMQDGHIVQKMCDGQFGLQTSLVTARVQQEGRQAALMAEAQLIVFIVETSDVSRDFLDCINMATRETALTPAVTCSPIDQPVASFSSSRVMALVMNSATLPFALQGHRSMSLTSAQLCEGQKGSRSEAGVQACCELFCGLLGINME